MRQERATRSGTLSVFKKFDDKKTTEDVMRPFGSSEQWNKRSIHYSTEQVPEFRYDLNNYLLMQGD